MTSHEFEVCARAAVTSILVQRYGKDNCTADSIQLVWYAHVLGNKKAVLIDQYPEDHRIYEVTYNDRAGELYVDTYEKADSRAIDVSWVGRGGHGNG